MSWNTQDHAVLQGYRRAYRLDTPSSFKNPGSHIVLSQGIGKFSPTMARPKAKRRVEKSHLSLAVRKNFNAQAVSEASCIIDWMYTVKNQGTLPLPSAMDLDTHWHQTRSSACASLLHVNKRFTSFFAPRSTFGVLIPGLG